MAWSRERSVLLPLVGGVVVAVLVLAGIMFRSSFQMERLRERSVVEATLSVANDKADRLEKRIIEQDNAVSALTENEDPLDFGARWLEAAAGQTPTVRAVLLVDLDEPSREVIGFSSRAPGGDDDVFRRVLLQRLWPELQLGGADSGELRHLHTTVDQQSYLVSHWERKIAGNRQLIVAWHDVPRIVHELFPRLYSGGDQANRVNVVDAEGRIVFGPPLSRGGLTLGRPFATTLYKWRVNVSMSAARELAEAVERRRILEMVLVALSSVVVIFGLIIIIIAAARERRLAMLKSEFVANVSHELKTPLSLVRMFSEMLLSGRAAPEKQQQYLEIIVNESERLSALIDNVLDFARMERRTEAYDFRSVDIVETVSRAVDVCRPRAERQHIPLVLSDQVPQDRTAKIDERAVEIAMINLIDNALKYAPKSEKISIEVAKQGEAFELSVTDGGPGIEPSQRRKIFERFVRGRALAEGVRGSGIGLSLVAQIAQAHGGEAWVENVATGGARFVMSVKL